MSAQEQSKLRFVTGAEVRDFYQNHWPGSDWYHDDTSVQFEDENGKWILADDAMVDLRQCGYLCWQGNDGTHRAGEMFPFIDFFEQYAAARTTELVTVEITRDRFDELLAAVVALGGVVHASSAGIQMSPGSVSQGPR
jgi:hypothetical protein